MATFYSPAASLRELEEDRVAPPRRGEVVVDLLAEGPRHRRVRAGAAPRGAGSLYGVVHGLEEGRRAECVENTPKSI